MKPYLWSLLLLSFGIAEAGEILRGGLESPYVLSTGEGKVSLGLIVQPEPLKGARPPVALSLVVDTSGSMQGEKIEHARAATQGLLKALRSQDQIALISFNDSAKIISSLSATKGTKHADLIEAVSRFYADGGTHIHDGLIEGFGALKSSKGLQPRLILISDGHATVGPTESAQILAGLPSIPGLIASSVGVGMDYDEKVLLALAKRDGGRFHHLTDPVQLQGIVQTELTEARGLVAREAILEVQPAEGVEIQMTPGLNMSRLKGGGVRLRLQALREGVERQIALQLKVSTQGNSPRALAQVSLKYNPLTGGPAVERSLKLNYQLSDSPDLIQAQAVPEFMIAADRLRVAHVLQDAAALLEEGDLLEAQAILKDERHRLESRRGRLKGGALVALKGLIALLSSPYMISDAPNQGPKAQSAPDLQALVKQAWAGKRLPDSALMALDKAQLRVLRNAPYARHGYRFKSSDLQKFFGKQRGYKVDPSFNPQRLSPVDVRNIARIKGFERRAGLKGVLKGVRPNAQGSGLSFQALIKQAWAGKSLPEDSLSSLSKAQLRILRNASYARHGYHFKSADLQKFFKKQQGYKHDANFSAKRLTPVDAGNIARVKGFERKAGSSKSAKALPVPVEFGTLLERARQGQALKDQELSSLSLQALRKLRNAAYARHGYRFRSKDLRDFFGAQSWYKPNPNWKVKLLSTKDNKNIRMIKTLEQRRLAGSEAVRDFKLQSQSDAQLLMR